MNLFELNLSCMCMATHNSLPGYRELVMIDLHDLFSLIAPPPAPSNFVISLEKTSATTMSFIFTWDSTFNSVHDITSYRVIPGISEGHSAVKCPSSCSPNTPCRCIGLVVGDQVNVSISAINCGNQDGPIRMVTVSSSKLK